MTSENDGLSQAEQAFFDSRGEADPAADPPAEAEAADPAPEGGGEEKPKEQHLVPVGALKAEREKWQARNKTLEQDLAKQREEWARADERIRLITEAQQRQSQPQEEQAPGPDDPMGQIEYLQRKVAQFEGQQRQQQTATQQATQQQQQVTQLVTTYQARASEFSQENPDFDAARLHLLERRARHLQIQGYDPATINQMIWHDEAAVVATALQQGANPAERIYALAKEYGYQPKAADKSDPAAAIDAKADLVARSKSLSQAGGQPSGNGKLDARALSNMSDEEFEAFVNKQGAKGFRRALHS